MNTQEPEKPNVKFAAVIEGFIAAVALTVWVKKHWEIDRGWYWIIGIFTLIVYCILFEWSNIFRIAAMIIVTPCLAFFAYAIGTSKAGYPVGILLAAFACLVSISAHLLPSTKNKKSPVIRGTALNTFNAAKARSARLLNPTNQKKTP